MILLFLLLTVQYPSLGSFYNFHLENRYMAAKKIHFELKTRLVLSSFYILSHLLFIILLNIIILFYYNINFYI